MKIASKEEELYIFYTLGILSYPVKYGCLNETALFSFYRIFMLAFYQNQYIPPPFMYTKQHETIAEAITNMDLTLGQQISQKT